MQQHKIQDENVSGEVKWFDPQKGYGFITVDESGEDTFLHISKCEEDYHPQDGDRVTFHLALNTKRNNTYAVEVRRAS